MGCCSPQWVWAQTPHRSGLMSWEKCGCSAGLPPAQGPGSDHSGLQKQSNTRLLGLSLCSQRSRVTPACWGCQRAQMLCDADTHSATVAPWLSPQVPLWPRKRLLLQEGLWFEQDMWVVGWHVLTAHHTLFPAEGC